MPELERELRALQLEWPPTPDLAGRVVEALPERPEPARARRPGWRLLRRPALAIGLALLLAGGAAAAVPGVRDAILDALGIDRAEVRRGPVTATPVPRDPESLGAGLGLGEPVGFAAARQAAALAPPRVLGTPVASYVDESGGASRVSYVYPAVAGIQAAGETGVAVLVTVFAADFRPAVQKTLGEGTESERLRVDGDAALWLSGASHGFAYAAPGGFGFEPQRLAGNTLLVQRGTLLIRIEARTSQERAVAIARSIPR